MGTSKKKGSGRPRRQALKAKDKATFVLMREPPQPGSSGERAMRDLFGVRLHAPSTEEPRLAPFPATSSLSPLEELRAAEAAGPHDAEGLHLRMAVLSRTTEGESLGEEETAPYLEAVIRLLAVAGSVVEGRRARTVLPCQRRLLDGLVGLLRKYEEELDDEITRARRVRLFDATRKAYKEVLRLHAEGKTSSDQRLHVAASLASALRDSYPLEDDQALSARLDRVNLDAAQIIATAKKTGGRGRAFTAAQQVVVEHVTVGGKSGKSTVVSHAEESSGIEVAAYLQEADGDGEQQDLAMAAVRGLLDQLRARRLKQELG